jgi:sporulation protein YlmC with PRC-barrel domain
VTTSKSIKVFSELRDLEIFDCAGELCGIADDVEFEGEPLQVRSLLVGPGAFHRRLPRGVAWLIRRIAGDNVVRVPWSAVAHVTSRITLNDTCAALGLAAADRRLRPLVKKVPMA